jgi:hypothetical protein
MKQADRLTPVTPENRATALPANEDIASRRFLRVLYARIVVFRDFLKCASAMPGKITEVHKGRWLLLQVAPETLLAEPDIFSSLNQLLANASFGYLQESVQRELIIVRRLFGPRPPTLFCMLDEAQFLRTCFQIVSYPTPIQQSLDPSFARSF